MEATEGVQWRFYCEITSANDVAPTEAGWTEEILNCPPRPSPGIELVGTSLRPAHPLPPPSILLPCTTPPLFAHWLSAPCTALCVLVEGPTSHV